MHRRLSLLTILAVSTACALSAVTAAAKTRTYSSGNLHAVIPGDDHGQVFSIRVPDKAKIKNVRVSLRANGFTSNLYAYVMSPTGQSVAIDEETASDGEGLGSGPNSCEGTPMSVDDEAATPLSLGTSPYAGLFQPYQPLTPFNTHQMKGRWNLVLLNYNNGDFDIKPGCWKLRIRS